MGTIILSTALHLQEFSRDHSLPLGSHSFHLDQLRFEAQPRVSLAICTYPVVSELTNRAQRTIRQRRHASNRLIHNSTMGEPVEASFKPCLQGMSVGYWVGAETPAGRRVGHADSGGTPACSSGLGPWGQAFGDGWRRPLNG